jgi:hypothetical protein
MMGRLGAAPRRGRFSRGQQAALLGQCEDAVAQPLGSGRMAVWPQCLRPAGEGDQQRGLSRVQRAGRLAEIGVGCGLNPHQIAAERGQGQPQSSSLCPGVYVMALIFDTPNR